MIIQKGICICGITGDKLCGKCRKVYYCSRDCQAADFPKHKNVCKIIKEVVVVPTTGKNAWSGIMRLPEVFKGNHSFLSNVSAAKLPLEELATFFLLLFTRQHQHSFLRCISPVLSVLKKGNKLFIMTDKFDLQKMSGLQAFTSFKDFHGGNLQASSLENMKLAFLCLSFFSKCNQIISCFGLLILKVLSSRQLTYGGERVVGSAVQDGYLKKDANIFEIQTIDIQSPQHVATVTESLRNGQPLPEGMTITNIGGGNSVHVWLTFVTESDRIFDLDLSAFQFGTLLPFPFIVPVLSAEPTALNGICDRDRIISGDKSTFEQSIRNLIREHSEMVNSLRGKSNNYSPSTMISSFTQTIEAVLHVQNEKSMSMFTNPEFFWHTLGEMESW